MPVCTMAPHRTADRSAVRPEEEDKGGQGGGAGGQAAVARPQVAAGRPRKVRGSTCCAGQGGTRRVRGSTGAARVSQHRVCTAGRAAQRGPPACCAVRLVCLARNTAGPTHSVNRHSLISYPASRPCRRAGRCGRAGSCRRLSWHGSTVPARMCWQRCCSTTAHQSCAQRQTGGCLASGPTRVAARLAVMHMLLHFFPTFDVPPPECLVACLPAKCLYG